MGQEAQTFSDFITDKDGDYSQAQFVALAARLLREGRRPDRVFKAMLRAAYDISAEHSISEHRDFVVYAAADAAAMLEQIEAFCDDMLAKAKH